MGNDTQDQKPRTDAQFRCGFVSIIGEPNAGKSTLMNAVLGTKLSIVTAKPQTTRKRLLGFYNTDDSQMIFIDTPGLIKPRYVLQQSMLKAATGAIGDSDVVIFLADAPKLLGRDSLFPPGLLDMFRDTGKPVVAVMNKVDVVEEKTDLLPLMAAFTEAYPFAEIIPVSALKNDGLDTLLELLSKLLPVSPPMYPPEMLSDQPERFFVSEIIREKIFLQFRQEVPYSTEVIIVEFKEKEDIDYIAADIIVERDSQKRIVVGRKGEAIKRIGVEARIDIEEFLQRKVYLELHVKIRERWRDSESWVRRFGYS